MKKIPAISLLGIACLIVASGLTARAANNKMCLGESGWSTTTGSGDIDCGLCEQSGTHTQTRTLGSCTWMCFVSCYMNTHWTTRTQQVTQHMVSPAEHQMCLQAYSDTHDYLDNLKTLCMIECLGFGSPPLIAACELACLLAHMMDVADAQCVRDECIYSCSKTAWNYSVSAFGCP